MFQNIFQHLQKCVCSNVVSSNTNIKFISYLVDGMQLMIFGELGIVGLEECPTYKKKKDNDIKYWSPKLLCNIQNCFGCHVSMYRYERSTKTMQVISTWHLLKNKDMGYSQQLILSFIWPYLKRVAWNFKFIWKIVVLKSTSKL